MSTALKNDLLLRAARGEATGRTPVWLMRQAGRILPQYRQVRASVSGFKAMVQTPELAAEVTLQPVDELGVDAAIIFSDILVIPEAMGLPYEMVEKKGPAFPKVIRTEKDLDRLRTADPESDLAYVTEAIRLTKQALDGRVPLIGFAGAPWTLLTYMVEGGGSKTFSHARRLLYQRPDLAQRLLELITQSTIAYLQAQIRAGADLVQLFDSWAGILSPAHYHRFSLPYLKAICEAIKSTSATPVTVFAKGAWFARQALRAVPCEVIGLDWNMGPEESRALAGGHKTLQGNLDACALFAPPATIREETERMLAAFGPRRHIANLGHGVYPDTPLDGVKCFVDTVKSFEHAATV